MAPRTDNTASLMEPRAPDTRTGLLLPRRRAGLPLPWRRCVPSRVGGRTAGTAGQIFE